MNNWGKLNKEDDAKYEMWFEQYVPTSGNCSTLGGEILRAITKIVYRYYNDGDTVDDFYGSDYNSCRGADIFLEKYIPNYKSLAGVRELTYEDAVCDRLKFIMDYLTNNPNVFETPNEDDYLNYQTYEPHNWDEDDDWDEDWDEDDDY